MRREKRAGKSINSLKERIEEHEDKLKRASGEGKIELMEYYKKELEVLKSNLKKKRRIAEK